MKMGYKIHLKTTLYIFMLSGLFALQASAFPTWMGTYGGYNVHDGANPGTFTILMNQDYTGLHAEVGYQVDGGNWTTIPMIYTGQSGPDSIWQVAPTATFPAGATVHYYFHGWDDWGGEIYDSNNGANYSFTVAGASQEVQLIDVAAGTGLGCYGLCGHLDIDVEVQNLAFNKEVGIIYTDDGDSWSTLPLVYLETLPNGNERWGYHNNFAQSGFGIQFAVYYTVNGETYWDNNNGQDYTVGGPLIPNVDQFGDSYTLHIVGSGGSCGFAEAHISVEATVPDKGPLAQTVGLVYTTDNWVTSEVAIGTADSILPNGALVYVIDIVPDAIVSECPMSSSGFDFTYAVYHTVSGSTYWDNNAGADYTINVMP